MSRIIIHSFQAGETRLKGFDFASQLSVGDTVIGATCAAVVFSGVDGSPGNVIVGSPSISGSVVSQKLNGHVAGVVYDVECTATTSLGQTLKMGGYLAVNPRPV